jgi:FKBP-type peptidyl-prolyl cis-trans isomerase FkpA
MKSHFFKVFRLSPVLFVLILSGCLESSDYVDPYETLQKDIATIDNYLAQTATIALKDLDGVRMVIEQLGTELPANSNSTVKVDYIGNVLGSTTPFETGTATGLVKNFIYGWQVALRTLPVGTKAKVYIPSPLAYGSSAREKIPANSILVFDMNFLEIVRTETEKSRFTSDTTAINNYINTKEIDGVIKDATGVRYKITEQGTGPMPELFNPVKIKLTYKLLSDDTKTIITMDRVPSDSFQGRVVDHLQGVMVGLLNLQELGKVTIYIPSILGFNTETITDTNGAVLFPANSNLIVEVELQDVIF